MIKYEIVWASTKKVHENLEKVCDSLQKCVKVQKCIRNKIIESIRWKIIRKYEEVWGIIMKYVKVWESMRKYEKVWESKIKYGKVWESMLKYEKVWVSQWMISIRKLYVCS